MKIKVEYYGVDTDKYLDLWNSSVFYVNNTISSYSKLDIKSDTQVVFLHLFGNMSQQILMIHSAIKKISDRKILLVVLGDQRYLREFIRFGVDEAFDKDSPLSQIEKRISFILEHPFIPSELSQERVKSFKIPVWKRIFDLVFAAIALVVLFPLMLILGLIILVESKKSVICISKAVGIGFKVFDLYKFSLDSPKSDTRTVYRKNNIKRVIEKKVDYKQEKNCSMSLETIHIDDKGSQDGNSKENKIKIYPSGVNESKKYQEITRISCIILKYNLDVLPQIFNVLKGDMSVVGRRPLTLLEAFRVKSDDWLKYFAFPVGLTGLWRIKNTSDEEYATKYSFWYDLRVIIRTTPGMFKGKV